MKILILGAGGVGGYFGARLIQAGADVTFLVREKREKQLAAQGLVIESPRGNATVPVKTVTQTTVTPGFDLVIFTCKAYDLADAMASIAPAVGENTHILPLLNGLAHMQVLNERFGVSRVWGGACKIMTTLAPDGVVKHLADFAVITYGAQDGVATDKLTSFKALLEKSGIEAIYAANIAREMWMKLTHLCTLATMTSLLRANVGEINRTAEGKALFREVFATHCEVATREGHAPDEAYKKFWIDTFTRDDVSAEASLLRDIERGGPTEADHILGFMLERVRAHGLPDTIHRLAYTGAKAYEQRRAAGRVPQGG
jgi:2-dehydropantoate 2-reductase